MKGKLRFVMAGAALAGTLGLASAAGAGASPRAVQPHKCNWATATSAAACGGMKALIAAAKSEGHLNVITDPWNWANYGTLMNIFHKRYGINITDINPEGSSADEIAWISTHKGLSTQADVYDGGLAQVVGGVKEGLFAKYKMREWGEIPSGGAYGAKNPQGYYYDDYGGDVSIGYNAKDYKTPPTWSTFIAKGFHQPVGLDNDPTQANSAFVGVYAAALANGGSLNNIMPGITYWKKIRAAGNYLPTGETSSTYIDSGAISAVVDWDFLNLSYGAEAKKHGIAWKTVIPRTGHYSGYYQMAIAKTAANPAAARLWVEFLYTPEGMNLRMPAPWGYARPVLLPYMIAHGTANKTWANELPKPPPGSAPFQTASLAQQVAAHTVVENNWG